MKTFSLYTGELIPHLLYLATWRKKIILSSQLRVYKHYKLTFLHQTLLYTCVGTIWLFPRKIEIISHWLGTKFFFLKATYLILNPYLINKLLYYCTKKKKKYQLKFIMYLDTFTIYHILIYTRVPNIKSIMIFIIIYRYLKRVSCTVQCTI